jgi:hypothetical protein
MSLELELVCFVLALLYYALSCSIAIASIMVHTLFNTSTLQACDQVILESYMKSPSFGDLKAAIGEIFQQSYPVMNVDGDRLVKMVMASVLYIFLSMKLTIHLLTHCLSLLPVTNTVHMT